MGVDVRDYVNVYNFNLYVCFELYKSFILWIIYLLNCTYSQLYKSFYILRFILLFLEVLLHFNTLPSVCFNVT